MRILLLNQTWFAEELTVLGHHVVSVGWRGDHFDVKLSSPLQSALQLFDELSARGFVADRVIYYDDSGPMTFSGVEELPVPTVFYSVDAHHHIAWHEYFARCFDLTLVAQRGYLERFSRSVERSQWFPLWSSVAAEPEEEKTIPVCFRGTLDEKLHPERASFFNQFRKFLPIDAAEGSFLEPFTKAEIVVNQAVKDDLNFRVFESMMCGPLLITPHLPQSGMELLFREGKHYISYVQGDAEDAAAKARYYLEHSDECRKIAKAGREEVLRRHTSKARAVQLQELLEEMTVTQRTNAVQGSAIAHFMTVIYCLKADAPMRLHAMRLALRKFEALATEEIVLDDQTVASLIMFKYFLEKYGLLRESAHLLGLYEDQVAGSSPLAIAIVDALNKVGERKRALAVAAATFSLPEAILEAADMLMKTTCKQLFSSFGIQTED